MRRPLAPHHESIDTQRHIALAAALAAALYAGFRLNECLGTDLVLMREPAGVALSWLELLNPKRTPAVVSLVGLTLVSGALALARARPRWLAAMGFGLLLVEDALTVLHVPLVLQLQRVAHDGVPADWGSLRARYVFDDVARTVVLVGASIAFTAVALRKPQPKEPS